MECPACKNEIEIEIVDVCNHGPDGGIDVFFECPQCLKSFGATVAPCRFGEFNPEDD